ncbi:hypothetical protein J2853_000274 [Streptosporangium lutulentum]|uniref:Uncharacterized protein n=1 Tax=Streptosporangium lutulentum TaxID=1461250 RepID=A0ABT9Q2W4_9ACTN|nr:hypothetical protein [Streptosporangium lutulentum]MDP9841063.1 hypothetical protein [Streptosporangium lutulentum]
MPFQIELAFQGLVDRFDHLPQRLEQRSTGPRGFVFAGRPQKVHTVLGQLLLEGSAVVVLIGDEGLTRPVTDQD